MTKRNQQPQTLQARAFSQDVGHFRFEVTEQEWCAELPKVADCHSLPVREYQFRAVLKKAASIIGKQPLSYGFNAA